MTFQENYDASFMVGYEKGYKKGYEEALYSYYEWLKKQSIVGFDYEHCDLLIVKYGRWVSAMGIYLSEVKNNEKTDK